MIGYIYFIINNITNQRYVGKTIDIKKRKRDHFNKLNSNKHINKKLQLAWNQYGQDNFSFEYIEFSLQDEMELNQKEIFYIDKYDSYNNGYNLTLGGDSGNTRGKISFEDYCFIYIGCQWKRMTNKIALYMNIDSSTVSAILREKSYLWYKQSALELPEHEKEYIINLFRHTFGIPEDKPFDKERITNSLSEDDYFYSLCIASAYGRGIETALAKFFGKHKSYLSNGIKNKTTGKAFFGYQRFLNLDPDEARKIGEYKFKEWDIQKYSSISLKPSVNDKWRY